MTPTVTRAMKMKLYPTQQQLEKIQQHCGATRYIHNYFLAINRQRYADRLPLRTYIDCIKMLTGVKKTPEHSWMATIHSQTLQQACKRLELGYTHFFREMKSGNIRQRPPVFKSKRDSVHSFCYPQGVRFNDARTHVFLPKIGYVKCRGFREFSNPKYKTLTIKLYNDGLVEASVSLVADNTATPSATWKSVGIDVGTRAFLTDSDGYAHPSLVNVKEISKLVKLQQQLARSTPGSENQRRMLNRAVAQQGWGIFFSILNYKLPTQDSLFYQVEAYGTSQQCHVCGAVDKSARQGKWYTCKACNNHCDADYNAGVNIRNRGYNIKRHVLLQPVDTVRYGTALATVR